MNRIILIWVAIGCVAGIAGCDTLAPSTPTSKPTTQLDAATRITVTVHPPLASDGRDPQPQLSAMVHLDIYVLEVPVGTVSTNEEFWKRVDEQVIGVANADRSNRNGIRCGVVPRSESLYFSRFFDKIPNHSVRSVVDDLHSNTAKLAVDKSFDQQDLFILDAQNELEGRSYDAGTNGLTLAFGPAPRKPGSVRLVFCPTVRSEKKHTLFTALNDEYETAVNHTDRLYDASITVNVPDDSFLILAPSGDASRRNSIGGSFLIKSDQATQMEQVILVMPTFIRLDGSPSTLPDVLVKPTPTTKPLQNHAR